MVLPRARWIKGHPACRADCPCAAFVAGSIWRAGDFVGRYAGRRFGRAERARDGSHSEERRERTVVLNSMVAEPGAGDGSVPRHIPRLSSNRRFLCYAGFSHVLARAWRYRILQRRQLYSTFVPAALSGLQEHFCRDDCLSARVRRDRYRDGVLGLRRVGAGGAVAAAERVHLYRDAGES